MKSLIAIFAVFCFLPKVLAEEAAPVSDAETSAIASAEEKEPLGEAAKKRLRHIGTNIEKLGKQAGKKLGVKTSESPSPSSTPVEESL